MNGKQAKRLRRAALGLAATLSEAGREIKKDGYQVKVHENHTLSPSSLAGNFDSKERGAQGTAVVPAAGAQGQHEGHLQDPQVWQGMTTIYRLKARKQPRPMDPLHVGNFYRKERLHREAMQDRQDLILYLAKLHAMASLRGHPRAFNTVKLRLTDLREWVYDYRPALDYFFEVQSLGYNLGEDNNEITTLIPKDLGLHTHVQTQGFGLEYEPPPRPDDGIVSKVFVRRDYVYDKPTVGRSKPTIFEKLEDEGRYDLIEPVKWIWQHEELNFVFKPAGKLQQRDTSVWPVPAVETWPSWLREALFGPGIDIDSAYTQYLMQHLRVIYADRPQLMQTLFPDLIALINNKHAWRRDLCENVLGLEWNDDNLDLIKTVCMSLANGSRISPGILDNGQSFSVTAQIIIKAAQEVTPSRLETIGRRLQSVSRQYSQAKKDVCTMELGLNPTTRNQKRVFGSYFEWEREARYAIWEAVDRHGIMVHDGLDGVPASYLQDIPGLIQQIGVRITS